MISINPMFKTPKVKAFIADLIIDYDRCSFDDLSHADKCEFSALLIDAYDKYSEHEFFTESKDLNQTIQSFKKALLGNHDDDENFLFTLKDNTVNYYSDIMEALFEEGYDSLQEKRYEWFDCLSMHGDPDEMYDNKRMGLI